MTLDLVSNLELLETTAIENMKPCGICGELLADSDVGMVAHHERYHPNYVSCDKCNNFWADTLFVWGTHVRNCGKAVPDVQIRRDESRKERHARLSARMEHRFGRHYFL